MCADKPMGRNATPPYPPFKDSDLADVEREAEGLRHFGRRAGPLRHEVIDDLAGKRLEFGGVAVIGQAVGAERPIDHGSTSDLAGSDGTCETISFATERTASCISR